MHLLFKKQIKYKLKYYIYTYIGGAIVTSAYQTFSISLSFFSTGCFTCLDHWHPMCPLVYITNPTRAKISGSSGKQHVILKINKVSQNIRVQNRRDNT